MWEDRKIKGPSDCWASHALGSDEENGDHRSLLATCGKPGAGYVPQQTYYLTFIVYKSGEYWDEPWEEWFVKAVKSFSIEPKE